MDVEQRARELVGAEYRAAHAKDPTVNFCTGEFDVAVRAVITALTPPEGSDQNLLELAATFETCIPFLPSAGQRNIGKAVAQLRHMAMGYVLVPVELPVEMEIAFMEAWVSKRRCIDDPEMQDAWDAALASRPEANND